MMRNFGRTLILCGSLVTLQLAAQEATSETETPSTEESQEADHEQLRVLREVLTEAVLKGDIERQIQYVHANVVTTWQNNRVARGHDGLRKFMQEMSAGNQKVFQGYTVRPTSDEVTILHGGDTAIAFGKSIPHYKLVGMEFDLDNRWTATLIKEQGQWKIAAYHVSGNILDNPVLTAAKQSVYWVAGISLVIGLLVGAVAATRIRNKPAPGA